MKKTLLILLALIASLCICLSSCGEGNTNGGTNNGGDQSGDETPDNETPGDDEKPGDEGNGEGTCEHSFGEWTVETAPTCTQEGSEVRSCEKCGKKETNTLSTVDHVEGDWILDYDATTEKEGLKHTTCTECGATVSEEKIPVKEKTPENEGGSWGGYY